MIDRSSHADHKCSAGEEIGHRLFTVNYRSAFTTWKYPTCRPRFRRSVAFVISSEQVTLRQHVFSQAVPTVGTQKRHTVSITKII